MHYGILHPTYPIKRNCVIKLPMKLLTPNLPLSNCVIKLHTKLQAHIFRGSQPKKKAKLGQRALGQRISCEMGSFNNKLLICYHKILQSSSK